MSTDEATTLDPGVVNALPKNSRVTSVQVHGSSFWADIRRVNVELADGKTQPFFLKVMSGKVGKSMLQGEMASLEAIHAISPEFVPRPLSTSEYALKADTHFLLCKFREMRGDMPDPHEFARRLAKLHLNSESPNGKFGFPVITYAGNLPQNVEWEDSWQAFFSRSLRHALDLEVSAKGRSERLDPLIPLLFEKIVPRLLGPLESDGRCVKPSLVHGDLWYANSGIDECTGEPLVFDPCCFYAHNEYEFGQWMPVCNRFGEEYLRAYHEIVPKSEPVEDYEGRLDLYKLRFNTHVSALFPSDAWLRQQYVNVNLHYLKTAHMFRMIGDIENLIDKYGE